ncbi:MAG: hypothetical protein A2W80_18980 [Candidatus Riflebacteria bacterium GWC2_50_8]|nr:MAG: hypothetical protein A2W80_18980 [Candidatus Riflebacteria bacterium GWC2_50_8]
MNIGKFNPNLFDRPDSAKENGKAETRLSFEADEKRLRNSAFKKDDLVNRFWNMTDSMPRDNQIAFAATVIAGRIMNQGMTEENQAFMKNVSNRFSPEEIGALKKQVLEHPAAKGKNTGELEKFFSDLEDLMASQKNEELDPLKKQQAIPRMRSADDIFFQTTSKFNPLSRVASV